ncbi:MAG: phosphoglycerate mutase family protein [Patescibacteria group bacterium]|nr:phosphoglycerate mutase family protein [Patescibacteria group bacterium]
MSKFEEKGYNPEKGSEVNKEKERERIIPIINIVRHGQTDYKELKNPDFKFDPEDPDFKLDPECLDLNQTGIKEIEQVGDKLANEIDKDKEVVIIITSPNYRAHSSALVLEERLKERGITILDSRAKLHPGKTIRKADNLQQIKYRKDIDKNIWIKKHQAFIEEKLEEFKDKSPDEVHPKVAKELGGELKDWFDEDYGDIKHRFQTFLRHMNNIDYYLTDETKQNLKDKKIRIINITHEELPAKFIKESLGSKSTLKKGQIMEIQSQNTADLGEEVEANVKLYSKEKEEIEKENNIKIYF